MSDRSIKSPSYIVKSLIAGGVAGCAAKTAIAPLDRVKILFQTSNPVYEKYSGSFLGVFRAMREIHAEHGFWALYQGHSATLLRIFPYAAIKYMSYEQFKAALMPDRESETAMKRMVAGSMAGVTSVFFSYPLELIRVRLAYEVRASKDNVSIWQTCLKVFQEENPTSQPSSSRFKSYLNGISNFYRGFFPTIYGMIPYAGVSFLTYETLKDVCMYNPKISPHTLHSDHSTAKPKLKVWAFLLCGAMSGALAQTSSYPFEVIRRTMQVAGVHRDTSDSYRTTIQTAKKVFQKRGLRGFFVGLSIGYVKVTPMFAVSFYTYELMKSLLQID